MKFLLPFTFILSFSYCIPCNAQDTMIDDISYPYLDKLIATAKENYPREKYFQSRLNASKIDLSQKKLQWFNSVSFSYLYQPNTTIDIVKPSLFDGYQIGVHLNLGNLLQTPGEIKRAKQDLIAAKGEFDEYQLTLEFDVKQRYFQYLKIKKQLQLYTKVLLEAESIEKEQKTLYAKSEIGLKEYSATLISLANYTTAKIETEFELLKARASLEEILGKKIEDIQ